MNKRGVTIIGGICIAIALAIGAMQAPTLASMNNVASFAPEGETRYAAVAQATVAPTATAANNGQRITHLERRVATLEAYRAADIQRIIALENAVFGQPPATLTPAPPTITPAPTTSTPRPPTATPAPTVTPPPHTGGFDCSVPVSQRNYLCGADISQPPAFVPNLAGQVCPAWVHDRYIASAYQDARGEWLTREANSANVAPHEVVWRTWHPNIDAATGCHFTHEHGFDWRGHAAMSGPPAFGLVGCLHRAHEGAQGDNHCAEPHEGFKAFRIDAGYRDWFEGGTALHHSYYVLHFGTSGAGRLTIAEHSFEQWQRSGIASDPWRVHAMGMPNFGLAGNICERDRGLLGEGNRTLMQDPAQSTCAANSPYEIWFAPLELRERGARDAVFSIGASSASFEPATAFRVVAGSAPGSRVMEVVPTGYLGCRREGYHEAGRYATYGEGPHVLYTDMSGNEIADGMFGGALQVFELPRERLSSGVGNGQVRFAANSNSPNIFKLDESRMTPGEAFGPGVHCYSNLRVPN